MNTEQQITKIGNTLRELRKAKGLDVRQLHLATKAHDPEGKGVHPTRLWGYERGQNMPKISTLRLIGLALDATWDDLLGPI